MEKLHLLIEKYGEKITVKRKTQITKYGDVEKYLYFIESGLVRMYTLNKDGKECTFDFVPEGDFTNAFQSFRHSEPSKITIETVTACVIYRFHKDTVHEALRNGNEELFAYIKVLESTFIRKLNREIELISIDKFQQFLNLVGNRNELFRWVRIKDLASYLGISDHTMSRYRKRIYW